MSSDRAQKLMHEVFGKIPTAESVVEFIEERNYEKLLEMMQDLKATHGDGVVNLLMEQVKTFDPEAYQQFQDELSQAKQVILQAHNNAVARFQADAKMLIQDLDESLIEKIADKFFPSKERVEEFIQSIVGGERPEGYPDNWPDLLIHSYIYEPLQDLVRFTYRHLPDKSSENFAKMHQNLASGLAHAAWLHERDKANAVSNV
jgi:hypothetical protein